MLCLSPEPFQAGNAISDAPRNICPPTACLPNASSDQKFRNPCIQRSTLLPRCFRRLCRSLKLSPSPVFPEFLIELTKRKRPSGTTQPLQTAYLVSASDGGCLGGSWSGGVGPDVDAARGTQLSRRVYQINTELCAIILNRPNRCWRGSLAPFPLRIECLAAQGALSPAANRTHICLNRPGKTGLPLRIF